MPGVRFIPSVEIPLRDGTITRADLYVPDGGDRYPTLLSRTPYSRIEGIANTLRLARRGYAVVMQDCRGRFGSEGEFHPFLNEGSDGVDSVEWCARQDWCNGEVGMIGASYFGATQLLCAVERPAALAAIAPIMTPSNYGEGWCYEGGVLQQHFVQNWALMLGAETVRRQSGKGAAAIRSYAVDDAAVLRPVEQAFGPEQDSAVPYYTEWLARRDDREWWDSFAIDTRSENVSVPALHVGGWQDLFLEGTLANYTNLRTRAANDEARDAQYLLVGPWVHGTFDVGYDRRRKGLELDMDGYQLAFFDHVLGRKDAQPPRVRVFVMGRDTWVDLEEWPPPAAPLDLYLAGSSANSVRGDGFLAPHAGPEARYTFLHDPQRPVPTAGGRSFPGPPGFQGVASQSEVDVRDDVLVFTSEPVPEEVTAIGLIVAHLDVASTATSFDVCVKIVDVDPTGTTVNVVDSVKRVSRAAGERGVVDVAVGSTAHAFLPGHRVRMQVSASNFPRLERNTDGPAVQTVFSGASRVRLPLWTAPNAD